MLPSRGMKMFTRAADGEETLDSLFSKLDGDRELLLYGEGSQTPYNQWFLAYFLNTSKSKRYYGLEVVDYGDTDVYSDDADVDNQEGALVVVIEDPGKKSLRAIADRLVSEFEDYSDKTIQVYQEIGTNHGKAAEVAHSTMSRICQN
jgi:hypothetical protein